MDGPKPTGRCKSVQLAGMLIPWHDDHPAFVNVPGSDTLYMPIFENDTDLRACMATSQVEFDKIKEIEPNVGGFLQSLVESPITIKLMANPYYINGRLRYLEIDPAAFIAE